MSDNICLKHLTILGTVSAGSWMLVVDTLTGRNAPVGEDIGCVWNRLREEPLDRLSVQIKWVELPLVIFLLNFYVKITKPLEE